METTKFKCSVAGDESYYLTHSSISENSWYVQNMVTKAIVWNGTFDNADQAIKAAEFEGFEFDSIGIY